MAKTTDGLVSANNVRWAGVSVNASKKALFAKVAARLVKPTAKAVYLSLEKQTGVPWWVIAVIHERESSQNWSRSLAQGDPWNRVSVHVPRGRGPFASFEEAGVDALVRCAPYAARWKDWSMGGALTLLEMYNGLGYARMGKPSPYIWAGTNQYQRGKYVRDGVYDASVVDTQLGCAGLLIAMREIDSSVGQPPGTIGPRGEVELASVERHSDISNNAKPATPTSVSVAGAATAAGAASTTFGYSTSTIVIVTLAAIAIVGIGIYLWRRNEITPPKPAMGETP